MVTVVGGGFAGVEAAWAAAAAGERVRIWEMRPGRTTGAHQTGLLAELVCSNSFKSQSPDSPAGLLKAEMIALGSLVIPTGLDHSVPAGEALGVDRTRFAEAITAAIESHPRIELVREHASPEAVRSALAEGPAILATGPLTSPELSAWLAEAAGSEHLYFYDAVSPTVEAASLDRNVVFAQSRYDKGAGDDYLNCPFDKAEYETFVEALVSAERALPHGVAAEDETLEKIAYFAGCMPIEAIAEKGARSLAFGNFKPVGLTDPRTGRRPYAALQLRPENRERTLYSMVACQTRLKWGEQKRVFGLVPGLACAEFVRFGVIHRNTYVDAPRALDARLGLRALPGVFLAGQITGVEGYVESAATGIYAGRCAAALALGAPAPAPPPRATALGSLLAHVGNADSPAFAPMNVNWGLLPEPEAPARDKGVRRAQKLQAAREAFAGWLEAWGEPTPASRR